MGSNDGVGAGGNKPHPAATNPQTPCGEVPGRPGWNDFLPNGDRPRIIARQQQHQQVDGPEGYAVAGKLLLAAAGALAGVLLALVALYLYNSARRRRLGGVSGGGRRLDRSLAIIGGGGEDSLRRDGASAPSPRGLDPAVLRALPVVAAGAGAGDCAVCLAELEPEEKARALPRCGHRFHAECIDAWFRGNATCPLCRADVVAPADEAPLASAPPEVRVDVAALDGAAAAAAAGKASSVAPAMGRLPSGTDLDKTRRVFASTRSVSF